MSQIDDYDTIRSHAHRELKIKGSRFIADAFPVNAVTEVKAKLQSTVDSYPDATHHCHAYRIFQKSHIVERSSDDGEPAGSAGAPILQVITGRQLYCILVVVTRYFGGTKLGFGGLIRAYTEITKEVLDACTVEHRIRTEHVRIEFPYELTGSVMHVISRHRGQIADSIYGEKTILILEIPYRDIDIFKNSLIESTANRISFHLWKSS